MLIRKLRLQRGWSQSQLADMAGVTTRTIQRLERGHKASLETAKALAAVFEVDLSLFLKEDNTMSQDSSVQSTDTRNDDISLKPDEQAAMAYARNMKAFVEFLSVYLILAIIFFFTIGPAPRVLLVFGALGAGLIIQGLVAFEVFSFMRPSWERKLAEKKLGRKL